VVGAGSINPQCYCKAKKACFSSALLGPIPTQWLGLGSLDCAYSEDGVVVTEVGHTSEHWGIKSGGGIEVLSNRPDIRR
jgi:hypothetical protein